MKILYTCTTKTIEKTDKIGSIDFLIREKIDVSLFPKYVKVYNSRCYVAATSTNEIHTNITVHFYPDNVNKGKNEVGMKRLEKFLKIMKQNFDNLEFEQTNFQNNLPLPENLLSIINS